MNKTNWNNQIESIRALLETRFEIEKIEEVEDTDEATTFHIVASDGIHFGTIDFAKYEGDNDVCRHVRIKGYDTYHFITACELLDVLENEHDLRATPSIETLDGEKLIFNNLPVVVLDELEEDENIDVMEDATLSGLLMGIDDETLKTFYAYNKRPVVFYGTQYLAYDEYREVYALITEF